MSRKKFTCTNCGCQKPFTSAYRKWWTPNGYAGICDDEQCVEWYELYARPGYDKRTQLERLRAGE